jgi:D-glycerate 3-kinase
LPVESTDKNMSDSPTSILAALIEQQRLPPQYLQQVTNWLQPLSVWVTEQRRCQSSPLLLGLNGAQGTGKSTTVLFLRALLKQQGLECCTLSLDDFYLSRAARMSLADEVHPLLATRGVPGTHDLELLVAVLDALLAGDDIALPEFSKAEDDVVAQDSWPVHSGAVDVIVLEGWCVGCPPQDAAALVDPVNTLEAAEDASGDWRRYVNQQLQGGYGDLFERLDALLMLQAPSMAAIVEWRQLQEQKLADDFHGRALMDAAAVERFVCFFERLTRHCLAVLPTRVDYLLTLDDDHCFTEGVPVERG